MFNSVSSLTMLLLALYLSDVKCSDEASRKAQDKIAAQNINKIRSKVRLIGRNVGLSVIFVNKKKKYSYIYFVNLTNCNINH